MATTEVFLYFPFSRAIVYFSTSSPTPPHPLYSKLNDIYLAYSINIILYQPVYLWKALIVIRYRYFKIVKEKY